MMKLVCCQWKEIEGKQIHTSKESFFQILPGELLRIILSFYTDSWKETIRFGSVCRTWKYECDQSMVWLNFPLVFYAPQEFYECRVNPGFSTFGSVISAGNCYPLKVLVHPDDNFNPVAYPSTLYKFEFYQGRQVFQINPVLDPISSDALPFQEALLARERFMRFFVEYHRLWAWFIRWNKFCRPIHEFLEGKLNEKIESYALIMIALLEGISLYFFSTLSNYPSSLSIENHFGFICLYLSELIFIILCIKHLFYLFSADIQSPRKQDLKAPFNIRAYASTFGIISYFLGIMGTLVFMEYNFSNDHKKSEYQYFSIPIWIGTFLTLVFVAVAYSSRILEENDWKSYLAVIIFYTSFLSAVPLCITLFSCYYASGTEEGASSPNSSSWLWYGLLPLVPLELFALLYGFIELSGAYQLWIDYWSGREISYPSYVGMIQPPNYYLSRSTIRFLGNFVKLLSLLLSIGLVVYFNIQVAKDQLDLSMAFILMIVLCFLSQCHLMASAYDHYYL